MDFKEIFCFIFIIIFIITIGIFTAQHMNVVLSGSMEPVLYRGDIVIVDNNVNDIQVGDIIVYNGNWLNPPIKIVHRVIEKNQTKDSFFYVTKGDHNLRSDNNLVQQNQTISKIVSINNKPLVIPKIGYIILIIKGL